MTQRRLGEFDAGLKNSIDEKIAPLSATFHGGEQEPFHTWYPYLEGYSPEFVETVLHECMGDVDSILDPFGGTVTTGFTASKNSLDAYYCEVNPVLQFVADTKARVRSLPDKDRKTIADDLQELSTSFSSRIDEAKKSEALMAAYKTAFNSSKYFDDNTLEEVLSVKTVVLQLEKENRILSSLLSVAVLSSLVPCSRLKRAGDLRFMNEDKLAEGTPSLRQEVPEKLCEMIEDINHESAYIKKRPTLLCENAQNISKIPEKNIDSVITSPPYINGTNYFRNTKLELWFLDCLQRDNDLSVYRNRALTAGINTVSGEYKVPDIELVQEVVDELEEHGYDSRLPLMVAGYCWELQEIFEKIQSQLSEGARVAIDIGDSIYAGVHVPADEMIIQLLERLNYHHAHSVKLRDRFSNNGKELKQVLLIFEYDG